MKLRERAFDAFMYILLALWILILVAAAAVALFLVSGLLLYMVNSVWHALQGLTW